MKICRLALPANPGGALHTKLSPFLDFVTGSLRARRGVVQALLAWAVLPALGLLLANASTAATAPPVNLTWNSNPENNITGYRVSYGTQSGVYPNTINVATTPAASITGLSEGSTYFFVVAAVNQAGLQGAASDEVSYQIPTTTLIPSSGWTLKYADSQESLDYRASYAFDNDPLTIWHTSWSNSPTLPPHEIQIDLGSNQSVSGFRYLPRSGEYLVGNLGQYEFYVSMDGVNWGTPVAAGIFPNNHDLKEARFPETTARFVRLRGMTDASGNTYMSAAEIYLIQGASAPAANQAPVASAKSVTTSESTSAAVTLSGTDADGNTLTFSVATGPTKGTLSGTAPNLTYTPSAGYTGSDSFTYVANDGIVNSAAATVSITVTPVNHAPVATQQSVSTPEDTPVGIVLTGSDSDGNPITYSIASNPAHGSLSGTAPNLTYTPAANYNGGDSFTFRVNDGLLNSAAATVSITVTPVNDAPVAVAKSVSTTQDVALPITLTGTDIDGNALTFSVIGGPVNGTLAGTPPNLTYTPTAGYVGGDSFTFQANDGLVDSATAVVSITVAAVNHPPVAVEKSITTAEDTAVAFVLSGSDSDGSPITYAIASGPSHGSLAGTAPNLTYIPAANYNGSDSFTFRVNDGMLNSSAATVSITITPVNDAPVATARTVTTTQGSALPVTLAGTDIEGNALTFSIVTSPTNGTLSGTPPNVVYQPNAGFNGSDQFTFKANDGTADSATATISITVTPVLPETGLGLLARSGWTLKSVDSQELFDAPGERAFDGDPGTFWHTKWRTSTLPALPHEIQINLGSIQNISGFKYLPRQDGLTIGNIGNYQFFVSLDGEKWGPAVATGTFANSSTEKVVTFSTKSGKYVRLRALSEVNGNADTCVAEINILKGALINQPPIALSQSITTEVDTPASVTLTGSDLEGTPLTYSIVSAPAHGTLTGTIPNLTYVPEPDYIGEDQFTFRTNDGAVYSELAAVSLTVTPVAEVPGNFAPAFASESIAASATEDSAFSGLLAATDANAGDTLTYRKLSGPAWLTVAADGTLGGTPLNGNVGTNTFTVKVADQFRASATATLTITVSNVNDAPVFKFNPIVYPAGTEKVDYREQTLASIAFDPDLGDSFTYSKVSGPEWLSVSTRGVLKGTPPANSAGLNQFTIRATDTNGASSESVLQIKINPNNLPLPWKLERVGSGNLAGPARYSAGVFTVGGSGALEEKSDAGNFGWQNLSGDGKIIACVEKVDDTGPDTRVGLMIRDSLAADSRQVFIGFSGKNNLRWMRRATTGGAAKESSLKVPDAKETWLSLTRNGNVITAYRSKDGKKWTKVGSISQALPANCYIGLSVSSGDKDLLNTSKFSHVRVNP